MARRGKETPGTARRAGCRKRNNTTKRMKKMFAKKKLRRGERGARQGRSGGESCRKRDLKWARQWEWSGQEKKKKRPKNSAGRKTSEEGYPEGTRANGKGGGSPKMPLKGKKKRPGERQRPGALARRAEKIGSKRGRKKKPEAGGEPVDRKCWRLAEA